MKEELTESGFGGFVKYDVKPGVWCIADCGGTEAREESPEPMLTVYVFRSAVERVIGVKIRFEADFEHGHGHEDKTSEDSGDGAGSQVLGRREAREHG